MRTRILIAVAAMGLLAAPAAALASHGKSKSRGKSHVTYELRGTLSAFTAAIGTTPGAITVHVTGGNRAGRAFVGDTLTFQLTRATRVETNDNGAIANGDRGEIQVKGPPGLGVAGIQKRIPRQVEDEAGDQNENHGDHGDHGDHHGDRGDS